VRFDQKNRSLPLTSASHVRFLGTLHEGHGNTQVEIVVALALQSFHEIADLLLKFAIEL